MAEGGSAELVVVFHAGSPAEANLVASRLSAAGCNAVVQGGTAGDEVAIARQLMNTGGVKVMVPRGHLARARLALAETPVSDDELEAQALAAGSDGLEMARDRHSAAPEWMAPVTPAGGGFRWLMLALIAGILIAAVMYSWNAWG